MRDQDESSGRDFLQQLRAAARGGAAQLVRDMVDEFGGRTVRVLRSRLLTWPGVNTVEPEPIAGLEAAHELERAVHDLAGDYIRLAREAGRSWSEIGDALDLLPYASANKVSVGEEAHGYAVRYHEAPGRQTFTWRCPACLRTVTDRGPYPDPPDREEGHEARCPRRAAEIAAWKQRTAGS
jgi:hypothetical protein